jgi:CDP-glycerol glycerophosphotransferase (TagB/SpsB family)
MNSIFEEKRDIVIFGAGVIGRTFYQRHYDDFTFAAFSDNNEKKHGKRYFGLEIIPPDDILGLNNYAVVICARNHYDVARQLFNMGIKSFWLSCDEFPTEARYMSFDGLTFMDFSGYESLEYHPDRIWLKEHSGHGGSCYAMWKYCQSEGLDLLLTERDDVILSRVDDYYAYHTSALVVTQTMDHVFGKRRVELWHGFPIKAFWETTNDEKSKGNFKSFIAQPVVDTAVICSYSKLYNHFFSSCTAGLFSGKYAITGMPRNDLLLRADGRKRLEQIIPSSAGMKVVVYAPTFREHHAYGYHSLKNGAIFSWGDFDAVKLEQFLSEQNVMLLVRMHHSELTEYRICETEHIKIIDEDLLQANGVRLYELLNGTDAMISDYSSIWVDYLLLDRPIIFAVRDLADYEKVHGLMIEPFEEWAPGELVTDMECLQSAIKTALSGADLFAGKRSSLTRMYHRYIDGNSSRRVIAAISDLLNSHQ